MLKRALFKVGLPVRKVGSTDTVGIVADFKEPRGNKRIVLAAFAAFIVAWLALVWDICRSLNWL
ncbi:hypothetical protein [Rhizobium sp. NPDC090279]|uniref:hypothetical protein n=1 Tax=Rhizobium sp. NPDC090279 TaxID=3364499 RepID=UPI00383BCA74